MYLPNPNPNPDFSPNAFARPVRLVYCDDKGKFCIDPNTVEALQLVKGSIDVVSVCDHARQGKSFILNQLDDWVLCRVRQNGTMSAETEENSGPDVPSTDQNYVKQSDVKEKCKNLFDWNCSH